MKSIFSGFSDFLINLSGGSTSLLAVFAGIIVMLLTSLGAFLAIFSKRTSNKGTEVSLAFAAGVMIVASFTSLILPGIEHAGKFYPVALGIILGIFIVYLIEKNVPHEHIIKGFEGNEEYKSKIKTAWLLVLTVVIHNLPEGLAVGTAVAFDPKLGMLTTLAIGIQDIPEGTVVALPLAIITGKRLKAIIFGVLSGFSELVMVVAGAVFFKYFSLLLPYGLGFAGGAMLYVTIKEMIPEIYKEQENEILITLSFFVGFFVMLFLDSSLM
ncbi:MAG: ZIP family metal transporter [Candidatus Neomarinimicrobiota bacterium]|nr:MAG: ZIP family metal transporter [Candidatus Neomarinimicrobiota bacterium]